MGKEQGKMMDATARSLFDNLLTAVSNDGLTPATRNKILHETLVLVCAEGLKDSRYGYGDLNSQTEALIRLHHIAADEASALRQARRDSNHTAPIEREQLMYDASALAKFIGRVFKTSVPGELTRLLPQQFKAVGAGVIVNAPDKRCIVKAWDEKSITVVIDEDGGGGEATVLYAEADQYAHMSYLCSILRQSMHLNLLGCEVRGSMVKPRLIIVEPDCLMDISVIASCFEEYGHHPLLYLVNRMKPRADTQPILLGNFASAVLDDVINNPHFSTAKTLIRNFREKALEYASCPDFDAQQFKSDAARQSANIVEIVNELRRHYDLTTAVLEPSFVCEKLGLQGRVDMMTTDMRLLVEQKSGRNINIERDVNSRGTKANEKHYVQVLLYYGILFYNFGVRHPDIRLLYSKYPLPGGLLSVTNLMQLLYEALRFRNEAIALEFGMADGGMESVLPQLTTETLNVAHQSGFFYENYLRPPLERMLEPLHHLSPLEHDYFCRMTQFALRENLLQKVGVVEGTGNCAANLWNMPLTEKRETGNIYTGLTIAGKEKSAPSGEGGFDVITLAVPSQGEDFLPNFRRGDMVYLYAYREGEEPDARRAMLFKGGLAEIRSERVVVKLIDGQQNEELFAPQYADGHRRMWCIEHGGSDVGGSAALRSLYGFITAPQERRDLLLAQREPRADKSLTLSRSYNPALDSIILKAKQARDYFLLVGPPGTGKTSMALQYMVKEYLSPLPEGEGLGERSEGLVRSESLVRSVGLVRSEGSILLMAYTNRAVDEICEMLVDNGFDFLRIGSELSTAEAFRPYLLQNKIGEKPTLSGMRQTVAQARIIVGTTSMMQSRAYIFNIKHFDLAIVDEASQILEPNIIGLLSMHSPDGSLGISKFILIGDYKQLPAVVQQNDGDSSVGSELLKAIGLTDCRSSLFERLIRTELRAGRTDFIGTLRRQGRMHPDIADFPSHEFYSTEHLDCVPLPHQLEGDLGYTLPSEDAIDDMLKAHRLLFFASKDCRQPEISDKVNAEEARIVADMLRRIHRFYGSRFNADRTVGVIVPYRNQIAMIRKEIERLGISDLLDVSIDTVERYQGSQRDVIIYSFTIQQPYQLSFLTANTFQEGGHTIDRKLNVALTRARRQLILTGNEPTLSGSPLFARLMLYIKGKGEFVSFNS